MNQDLHFTIDNQTFLKLKSSEVTLNEILKEHLLNQVELKEALLDLHPRNGNPSVPSCEIEEAKTIFNSNTFSGSFILNYTLEYYFSCDDMSNTHQHTDEFKISFDERQLTFRVSLPIKWELDN